ncbi:von Willebrand factor A domain-containing protein 2 [Corythoichthys intestinalis]|uniref:von Willebrand factor A domain-containing protein 2 n=1 Tax=Corythoichthys intestinalis TaxID=161448 RepID=UPI0025A687AA|nr:von Willebrand factor A domain-containing protein 2 [Corythoichthys intestinalis]XP_061807777.1 von Willebrand factor A domain-containing protein 2-like [Nerophis lumbriciformis]
MIANGSFLPSMEANERIGGVVGGHAEEVDVCLLLSCVDGISCESKEKRRSWNVDFVQQGTSVQEIQTSRENLLRINSARELMQCSAAVDVLFLLDGSYSVGKANFERGKHFALKLCQVLDIRPDKARVGFIQFGSVPRLEFALDSYSTKRELRMHLKKISYRGGSTQTGLALKYLLWKGFPGGRDNSSTAARVAVLLSDGMSQGDAVRMAAQLKKEGVVLFSVGLRYPRWEELHALASEPTDSHVFFAEHFADAVNGLYTTLTTTSICNDTPAGCQVEAFPCERKTLETVKELQGNFMCWKGSNGFFPQTSVCPYYSYKKAYKRHPSICHRTVCPDPCDSEPCLNGGTCVSETQRDYTCICPPGYGGDPHCAPALSLDCAVDLLFLLEGSDTLPPENFQHLKSFLKRFLKTALGSGTPSKIGLAVFGREAQVEARVGEFKGDLKALLEAADTLRPVGGPARTGQALRYVTRNGFVNADVTDDLPRVVVLLTGTPAVDQLSEPSKYARDREIFLVAVGPDSTRGQLDNITGNPQRTLTYASPDKLAGKILELKAKICSVDTQGCLGQAVDLVFVLDASSGVGRANFAATRDFARSLTVQFDINRDLAQVALVTYGRRAVTVFDLATHQTGSDVLEAATLAGYAGGRASTGAALLHVRSDVLTAAKGARPGVGKAVVLLTDSSGGDDALVPARSLREDGVALFVVGVGDVQRDGLLRVAGSEERLISVPFYEDLKYFEDVVVQMVCSEMRKPVDVCKPNPCMNEGMCVLSGGSYSCQCHHGFQGPHCETRRSVRSSSRRDLGLRNNHKRQKKSHPEFLRRYKVHGSGRNAI